MAINKERDDYAAVCVVYGMFDLERLKDVSVRVDFIAALKENLRKTWACRKGLGEEVGELVVLIESVVRHARNADFAEEHCRALLIAMRQFYGLPITRDRLKFVRDEFRSCGLSIYRPMHGIKPYTKTDSGLVKVG